MDLIIEYLETQHPVVPGLILAALIILAVFLCWSPVQQLLAHWRLHSLVNRLGRSSLRNVYLPDGLGDVIYIEQLLLRPTDLLLVTIKPYRGNIFAAEKIDLWTQVTGHHSHKFANPMHQQERDLQALNAIISGHPVNGMVVFARGCRFPKGKPEQVRDYQELKAMGADKQKQEINPDLLAAWKSLSDQAEVANNMAQPILYRPGDKKRLVGGLFFGCLAIAYALLYLGVL